MLIIGTEPEALALHLSRDADFGHKFESYVGEVPTDYPPGTAIRLDITDDTGTVLDTWSATVAGNTATFAVDKADVNTVLDLAGPKYARLYYVNGTDDDLWAAGPVRGH